MPDRVRICSKGEISIFFHIIGRIGLAISLTGSLQPTSIRAININESARIRFPSGAGISLSVKFNFTDLYNWY